MLTEKEETLLDQAFGKQELKELTQQQSAKIASRTNIPLRAVEYFALGKGYLPRRYRENIGTLGTGGAKKTAGEQSHYFWSWRTRRIRS